MLPKLISLVRSQPEINSNQFKVTLINNEHKEVQYIQCDDLTVPSKNYKGYFDTLILKLSTHFPTLPSSHTELKLTWTGKYNNLYSTVGHILVLIILDQQNDNITIKDDKDLVVALQQMKDLKVFKLYMTKAAKKLDDDLPEGRLRLQHSFNINGVCDNCNCNITPFRYKCLQCSDYNLCKKCYKSKVHDCHNMMSITLDIPDLHNMHPM